MSSNLSCVSSVCILWIFFAIFTPVKPTNLLFILFFSCIDDDGKLEFRIKIPNLAIGVTKSQLMMLIELAKSWAKSNPYLLNQMLVDDVFYPKGIDLQIVI